MGDFKQIALVVAAGKGLRMQSDQKKQYLALSGIPVLVRTLKVFAAYPVDELILVIPQADLDFCRELVFTHGLGRKLIFVPGGSTRQASVRNGLARAEQLSSDPKQTIVMVHDGVRPFITHEIIDRCLGTAATDGAAIPAIPITDTVKAAEADRKVQKTLDRTCLFRAQTPQTFRLDLGLKAFDRAGESGFSGTDEASLFEHAGIPVTLVEGARFNIKLTTPHDLSMAEFILNQKDHKGRL